MSAGGIFGSPGRTRTSDPAVNRRWLRDFKQLMVPQEGFEPPTPALRSRKSRRLCSKRWCPRIHSRTRESAGRAGRQNFTKMYSRALQRNSVNWR
jgi:hypothetical protein